MLSIYPTAVSPSTHSSSQNTIAILTYASIGAACGKIFGMITPIGGALFNTSAVLARFTWEEVTRNSDIGTPFKIISKVVIPLLSALAVCLTFGYSLSIWSALEIQVVSFLPWFYLCTYKQMKLDSTV